MADEGIHELAAPYALDALESEEARAFESHLARCARCREDVASFQEATAALAYGIDAPAPPPLLRHRIVQQARAERADIVPIWRKLALPVTATVAAVAATVALALGLWAASLSDSLERERAARQAQNDALAVLASEDARRIPVAGRNGALVVAPTGEAALVVSGLGPAPEGKTYEAWVIEEGTPRPAGLFRGGGRVVVPLERPVPRGAVVAVTVEPEGGVERPTGKPIATARVA